MSRTRSRSCWGFTLVELLVAVAITAVLFTLLFIPMTQAFDQARRGRIMASLQAAADFAIEGITRDIKQALWVFPQQRIDDDYDFDGDGVVNEAIDLLDGDRNDDDSLGRVDFVLPDRVGELVRLPTAPLRSVVTYYGRIIRPVPTAARQGFKYLSGSDDPDGDGRLGEDPIDGADNDGDGLIDEDDIEPNPRALYRASWIPDPNTDSLRYAPSVNRWLATGRWMDPNLEPVAASHSAVTPLEGTDISDLRFILESVPGQPPRSVVIQFSLRKPTPGAKPKTVMRGGRLVPDPTSPDVASILVTRRVRVVLDNVR
ncbi:MAG: type II secretion system GspH family protein [Armatimonadetes bacterium]|nr:type II secretion system GspH family protein [Armatimonadota bacterium]MDW8122943.1 type II secretion system protein [Armatimonadota bacterium]